MYYSSQVHDTILLDIHVFCGIVLLYTEVVPIRIYVIMFIFSKQCSCVS